MIDLNPNHLATVERILAEHVPECEARAFGSRATWTAKDYSDLDLAIVGAGPLDWRTLSRLKEAFEESDLPMRVDVLDWHDISESFRDVIERDYVVVQEGAEQTTAGEWRTATVGEIAEKVAMGPFGSSIKVETFVPEGVPVISGQHLHRSRVDDTPGFNFISLQHAQRLANANVMRGDVVFTHAGNIGQVAYVPENSQFDRYVISQRQFYMRCDRSKAIPEFVTMYFRSPEGRHQLLANTSQVGVPSIAQPVTYLRTIEIPLPPLPEQRAIAHILGTLDDKIELNRRMNETLEEMARALFQSWFVDFDPVRAKMEGRDTGLPPDLAAFFPDRLVESELGLIPEGWEVGTVSQLAERIQNGGTPKRSEPTYWNPGEIPWLTSAEVRQSFVLETENLISQMGLARSSAKVVPARSILVALYGATAGQVSMNFHPLSTNQAISAIIPSEGNRCFCLVSLKSQVAELGNRAVGSAQQNISKKAVESTTIVLPSIELRSKYNDLVEGMFDRILQNLEESRTLIAQRDALLPKLVSGEVGVAKPSALWR